MAELPRLGLPAIMAIIINHHYGESSLGSSSSAASVSVTDNSRLRAVLLIFMFIIIKLSWPG